MFLVEFFYGVIKGVVPSRLGHPTTRQLAIRYLNSREVELMPHFSDVGSLVSVNAGKA
jgi:hypothetical protein